MPRREKWKMESFAVRASFVFSPIIVIESQNATSSLILFLAEAILSHIIPVKKGKIVKRVYTRTKRCTDTGIPLSCGSSRKILFELTTRA